MRIKVGVVAHSEFQGGAEAYLCRLYAKLDGSRFLPRLYGSIDSWEDTGSEALDLHLSNKWAARSLPTGLVRVGRERNKLLRVLSENEHDVFHLQFKREQIGFTAAISKLAPVVWTEHGIISRRIEKTIGPFYARAAQHVSTIVCVSDAVADSVRKLVGSKPQIEVIENSVDTERFQPAEPDEKATARRALGITGPEPIVAWVGRLHANKLPDIAARLGATWPGWIVVAGDGAERVRLDSIAAQYPNVLVLGQVNPCAVYKAADVFMFTSNGGEGYPTTLLEAASSGLGIVANRSSGIAPILAEFGGLVVQDHHDLAEWREKLTLAMRVEQREAAFAWGRRHDLTTWVNKHAEVLSHAAKGG